MLARAVLQPELLRQLVPAEALLQRCFNAKATRRQRVVLALQPERLVLREDLNICRACWHVRPSCAMENERAKVKGKGRDEADEPDEQGREISTLGEHLPKRPRSLRMRTRRNALQTHRDEHKPANECLRQGDPCHDRQECENARCGRAE